MRSLILVVLSLFVLLAARAQNGKVFNGKVVDKNQMPIAYATILVYANDTTQAPLFEKISSDSGTFTFAVNSDDCFVKVSQVGYQTYSLAVSNKMADITVVLENADSKLEGVTVASSTRKTLITRKIDRIVMNVQDNAITAGKNAQELFKMAPGVFVNNLGDILVNGQGGVRVMVDGRLLQLSGDDLTNFLKNLRAEDIQSLEIIPHPSAEYDAGSNALINIVYKKNRKAGFTGSVASTYTQGRYPSFNENVQLNYKSNKLGLSGGYTYDRSKDFQYYVEDRAYTKANYQYHSRFDDISHSRSSSYRIGATYDLTDKQYIGLEFSGSEGKNASSLVSKTSLLYPDTSLSRLLNGVFDNPNTRNFKNVSFNYNLKTDSLGSNLSVKADYTSSVATRDNASYLATLYTTGTFDKDSSYRNSVPSNYKIWTGEVKYLKKLNNDYTLSGGGKMTSSDMRNNAFFQYRKNGNWIDDANQSYVYNYLENIYAGFVNFNGTFLKTEFQTGLRMEYTSTKGDLVSGNVVNKKNYPGWFPSVFLKKNTDSAGLNYFTFSFNRQIRRPSYWQLNPFVTNVDAFTKAEGNPYLQPQFSNNYEVGFTLKGKYNLSVGYHTYSNNIAQIMFPGDDSVSMIYRQANIDGFNSWTANLSLPIKITKFWESNTTISAYTSDYKMPNYRNKKTTLYFQTSHDIQLPWELKFSVNGFYTTALIQGNYNVGGFGGFDIGLQKAFFNKKLTANIALNDVLYSQKTDLKINYENYVSHSFQKYQTRTLAITLRYNFSVGKKITMKKVESSSKEEQNRL
ncbi:MULTISPECIES: TonB-dependent receptor domain-containing protein [Chitinophagaceae]